MDYKKAAADVKTDSFKMAALPRSIRDAALKSIIEELDHHKADVFAANQKDLEKAAADQLPAPIQNRLKFDAHKLSDCISGMEDLAAMEDPLFKELLKRQLDEGLTLIRTTCPIGVIGVIFESRPDALVQISSLCIKSGNCAILKGGSEAANTNRILFDLIYKAGINAGLPENFAMLIEDRAGIDELLKCHESVDLIIPRGSNQFVQYIMANSKIPVMGHADGVCHVYVDKAADLAKAVPIVMDSKTQYVAACNTAETLLVNRTVAGEFLPALADAAGTSIEFRGDETTCSLIGCKAAEEKDFETEYLDYILSIKIVDSLDEAIQHINHYGSHHTDCIITEDKETAARFMANVDSAGVYQNCSTRFADGFRYGFGAEVGISTGKLHARGPVGLEGLVTYKYKLFGNGQIVADYASGTSSFHFKDLK